MAITVITPVQLVTGTVSADLPIASGTAINASNTMTFAYPKEGRLIIQLNNTFAGAKNFTFAAGENISSSQGALVVAMAQDDVRFITVNSSRHCTNNLVTLSFEASTTGFVQALYVAT